MNIIKTKIEDLPSLEDNTGYDIKRLAFSQIYSFFNVRDQGNSYMIDDVNSNSGFIDEKAYDLYKSFGIFFKSHSSMSYEIGSYIISFSKDELIDEVTALAQFNAKISQMPFSILGFNGVVSIYIVLQMNEKEQLTWAKERTAEGINPFEIIKVLSTGLIGSTVQGNSNTIVNLYVNSNQDVYNVYRGGMNHEMNLYRKNEINSDSKVPFKFVDISNLFVESKFFLPDFYVNYQWTIGLIDKVLAMRDDFVKENSSSLKEEIYNKTRIIFYCDRMYEKQFLDEVSCGSQDKFNDLYSTIAAYLNFSHGVELLISTNSLKAKYLKSLLSMRERDNNHFGEYVKFFQNLPQVAISTLNNVNVLCIKNTKEIKKESEKFSIKVHISHIPLENTFDVIQEDIVNIEDLDILDLAKEFGLDTFNSATGMKNLTLLKNKVLPFDRNLKLTNDYLCCNNLLLLNIEGKKRLAYVHKIDGELPFICQTLNSNVIFSRVLSFSEIESLQDINIYSNRYDLNIIKNLIKSTNDADVIEKEKSLHFQQNKNTKGILMYAFDAKPKTVNYKGDEELDFDTVGIWGSLSKELRSKKIGLVSSFIPLVGIRENYLNYYGSSHFYSSNAFEVRLTKDFWISYKSNKAEVI